MKTIIFERNNDSLVEVIKQFTAASYPVALTGAGISVGSGIADFRSPGGLWSTFSPEEYATLEVFQQNPEKAWTLYRKLGKCLLGKEPNRGHRVLAELGKKNLIKGLITQNVDNLHQLAGSKNVLEIHGDHQHLQCLKCNSKIPVTPDHYQGKIPCCNSCNVPLKPNIVLFGEDVRQLEKIELLINRCDFLLVIGTSARVYPAAQFPGIVLQRGGIICEFNKEQSLSISSLHPSYRQNHYFIKGDLNTTLPQFAKAALNRLHQ